MTKKREIRIIKSNQKPGPVGESRPEKKTETSREQSRQMMATVSSWVREFQRQHQRDARLAFESLFTAPQGEPAGR